MSEEPPQSKTLRKKLLTEGKAAFASGKFKSGDLDMWNEAIADIPNITGETAAQLRKDFGISGVGLKLAPSPHPDKVDDGLTSNYHIGLAPPAGSSQRYRIAADDPQNPDTGNKWYR